MPEEEQLVDEGGGCESGADPGFSWGGGGEGGNIICGLTHITSAKPELPYGRGPGPA